MIIAPAVIPLYIALGRLHFWASFSTKAPNERSRKYHKINFTYVRKNCNSGSSRPLQIEIRSHEGTIDFNVISNWIIFLNKFIANTIARSILQLTRQQFINTNGNHNTTDKH